MKIHLAWQLVFLFSVGLSAIPSVAQTPASPQETDVQTQEALQQVADEPEDNEKIPDPVEPELEETTAAEPAAPETSYADAARIPQLFFPMDKNGIKILPPRFEYQLLNRDQLRIGDLTLDARLLSFQLIPTNKKRTNYKMRFRWPMGFLQEGELVIKDNAGKALAIKPIRKKDIIKIKTKAGNSTRSQMASLEISDNIRSIFSQLSRVPFFKFCVHRQEPLTKIYLCSKDLYIKKVDGQLQVMTRESFRPESYVDINGRNVNPQGYIYLNSASEHISFRGLLLSGATVELDTRLKVVNFKDGLISEDGKKLIVRAAGAEPADESLVTRLGEDEWQVELDTERPLIYLKGEGDIPLKQEFLIEGKVRKDNVRVPIQGDSPLETYDSQETLGLRPAEGIEVSLHDKGSTLEKNSDGSSDWTLLYLRKNHMNRRFIRVLDGNQTYYAAYDIYRASPNHAYFRVMSPLWAQAGIERWFSRHIGVQLQYDQKLESSDPEFMSFEGRLKFRLPGGMLGPKPYWALMASVKNQKVESDGFNTVSLGAFTEQSFFFLTDLFPKYTLELMVPVMSMDSDYKLESSYETTFTLRHYPHQTLYYEAGLRYHSYNLKIESVTEKVEGTGLYALLGIGWIF